MLLAPMPLQQHEQGTGAPQRLAAESPCTQKFYCFLESSRKPLYYLTHELYRCCFCSRSTTQRQPGLCRTVALSTQNNSGLATPLTQVSSSLATPLT